jgi:hypothetical protein
MAGSERLLLGLSRLAPPVGPLKVPQGCKTNRKKLDALFAGAWRGLIVRRFQRPSPEGLPQAGINTDWWPKARRFIESKSHLRMLTVLFTVSKQPLSQPHPVATQPRS